MDGPLSSTPEQRTFEPGSAAGDGARLAGVLSASRPRHPDSSTARRTFQLTPDRRAQAASVEVEVREADARTMGWAKEPIYLAARLWTHQTSVALQPISSVQPETGWEALRSKGAMIVTKILEETMQSLWPGEEPAPRPTSAAGIGARPGFRPLRSKWELKADETTRVAREITDAEMEKRQAGIGRLRRARLERDAAEKTLAALRPPKKKRRS